MSRRSWMARTPRSRAGERGRATDDGASCGVYSPGTEGKRMRTPRPRATPPVRTDGGEDTPADDTEQRDGAAVEDLLRSAGVVEVTDDGRDIRLTDAFARAWRERIEQMSGGDRALRWLAASRGIDAEDLSVEDSEDRYVVTHDGETVGAWHSRAGFLAAIVAEPVLQEWVDEEALEGLPETPRAELADRLVMCLEQCPDCGGRLDFVEQDGEEEQFALDCADCGATVAVRQFV